MTYPNFKRSKKSAIFVSRKAKKGSNFRLCWLMLMSLSLFYFTLYVPMMGPKIEQIQKIKLNSSDTKLSNFNLKSHFIRQQYQFPLFSLVCFRRQRGFKVKGKLKIHFMFYMFVLLLQDSQSVSTSVGPNSKFNRIPNMFGF